MFQIESRYPEWAKWKKLIARPNGEIYPFNPKTHVLEFDNLAEAEKACNNFREWNAAEFRVTNKEG